MGLFKKSRDRYIRDVRYFKDFIMKLSYQEILNLIQAIVEISNEMTTLNKLVGLEKEYERHKNKKERKEKMDDDAIYG